MKKLKCYLSILLILSMMLSSTSMFTVNAAQVTETEDVVVDTEANLGGEDELQPMMANGCNQYGSTSWTSIDKACDKYLGKYWEYDADSNTWSGNGLTIYASTHPVYNYYILHSDGSRTYFGVHAQ